MSQPEFLKKAYLKRCLSKNDNPDFEIVSALGSLDLSTQFFCINVLLYCIYCSEKEKKTLNLKNRRITDQNLENFMEIIIVLRK